MSFAINRMSKRLKLYRFIKYYRKQLYIKFFIAKF